MIDNVVIESVKRGDGELIVNFFKDLGVDTHIYSESLHHKIICRDWGDKCIYYGVIKGVFCSVTLAKVKETGVKIIKLPVKNDFPKWMYVSDTSDSDASRSRDKRLVTSKNSNGFVAFLKIREPECFIRREVVSVLWKHAVDIPDEIVKHENLRQEKSKHNCPIKIAAMPFNNVRIRESKSSYPVINTTLIELRIKENKKAEKFHKKHQNPIMENFHRELKEQFQDCLNVVTGSVTGYLSVKDSKDV